MVTVAYTKPFTNNIEQDVKEVRASYLQDLEKLREYYGTLFTEAAHASQHQLRRIV